jgi:hypothetical protein
MTKFDPHPILDAAFEAAGKGDAGKLHRRVRELGPSMRTLLYHAGWRMLDAIAAADDDLDRLRSYARNLSPEARGILEVLAEPGPERNVRMSAVTMNALRLGGLLNNDGVTDDGREVLRLLKIDAMLRVRDTALSDEDLDHDERATRGSERTRGVWPS